MGEEARLSERARVQAASGGGLRYLDGRERGLLQAEHEGEEDDEALREVRGEVVQEELWQSRRVCG